MTISQSGEFLILLDERLNNRFSPRFRATHIKYDAGMNFVGREYNNVN